MPEIAFVTARRQNLFWTEIIEAVRRELNSGGVKTSLSSNGFPPERADLVYALVPPHEWFALEVASGKLPAPQPGLLRRTLFLCGEQPGTSYFDENVALARDAGAVFDLSRGAVREYAHRGISAAHFQLGYTPEWDLSADKGDRDIDILFLGSHSPRRSYFLSAYADSIWRKDCRIVFSDNAGPNWKASSRYLAGAEKWNALGRAKTLLSLHQGELPYFEWPRAIQALTCGCVLVSEESMDYAPLEPGEHFISGRPESLALLAHSILEDDHRRRTLQRQAYEFIRDSMPLRDAVAAFATAAEEVAKNPLTRSGRVGVRRSRPENVQVRPRPSPTTDDPQISALLRIAKDTALQLVDVRRAVEQLRGEYARGGKFPLVEVTRKSRGYPAARPRVSVITSVYNHGEYLGDALSSVAGGVFRPVELIVVDDASTDKSLAQARDWIQAHESVPALLLHHPVNRGLPCGRNTALGFARGEFVFILDADNALYPKGLWRLVQVLDANPDAAFAYGLHQRFGVDGPEGVANLFPWEPRRLRTGNYIDAMALVRTRTLRELGGYTTDGTLHGWEDFDLWCRMAELGHQGVFVPQFVARYRVLQDSMLSLSNLSSTRAFATLLNRFPRLMAGVQPPV